MPPRYGSCENVPGSLARRISRSRVALHRHGYGPADRELPVLQETNPQQVFSTGRCSNLGEQRASFASDLAFSWAPLRSRSELASSCGQAPAGRCSAQDRHASPHDNKNVASLISESSNELGNSRISTLGSATFSATPERRLPPTSAEAINIGQFRCGANFRLSCASSTSDTVDLTQPVRAWELHLPLLACGERSRTTPTEQI